MMGHKNSTGSSETSTLLTFIDISFLFPKCLYIFFSSIHFTTDRGRMEGEDGIGAILVPEFYRPIRAAAEEHIWYKWRPLNRVDRTLRKALIGTSAFRITINSKW